MLLSRLASRLRSKRVNDRRRVYRAPNGRWYDPLACRRVLELTSGGAINMWVEEQHSADPRVALAADAKVLDVVRPVFGLPPIDPATGRGVTDAEALALFADFQGWLWGKGARG